jgi:hypothetical protein
MYSIHLSHEELIKDEPMQFEEFILKEFRNCGTFHKFCIMYKQTPLCSKIVQP